MKGLEHSYVDVRENDGSTILDLSVRKVYSVASLEYSDPSGFENAAMTDTEDPVDA
jgi:hypothetical protein